MGNDFELKEPDQSLAGLLKSVKTIADRLLQRIPHHELINPARSVLADIDRIHAYRLTETQADILDRYEVDIERLLDESKLCGCRDCKRTGDA